MQHINKLKKEFKSGIIKPIYLIYGSESYFIDEVVDFFTDNLLTKAERAFNQVVFYGKDTDSITIIENAMRLPMMATRTVVIIKEAQHCRDITKLEKYTNNPSSKSVLILAYKKDKADKRTKWVSGIRKNGAIIECKTLYDNQIGSWISETVRNNKRKINSEAIDMLKDYFGTDISKISQSIEKLYLHVSENETIRSHEIEKYLTINNSFSIFKLQSALSVGDTNKALQIAKYLGNNKDSPAVFISGLLYTYFSRIWKMHLMTNHDNQTIMRALGLSSPFFLKEFKQAIKYFPIQNIKRAFVHLHDFDIKSKGMYSGKTKSDQLLMELIVRLSELKKVKSKVAELTKIQ